MASMASSLPVPDVQALSAAAAAAAANGTYDVPDRYVRPEAESDPVVDGDESRTLPIIDLELLMNPEVCEEERAKLDLACREWGFFQLINHGVPAEVMEKVKEDVAKFFKLPLEEKEAFKQLPSGVEGYGNLFVISEEQKLDWKDILVCYTQPQTKRNMRFWPTNPPTFRETVDNYSSALKGVSTSLLGSLSHCLGLESQHLINVFGEQVQAMQFNYYPPCPKANKVLGHSPHSDGTGLTILLQANNVSGLQIKKSGKWFTVEPLPGAFVVNVGDLLEIFSNGRYKSVEHRATINPENARISVAAFHTPACKIIGPLPELLKGGEELYKTTSVDDFERGYFAAKLNGKSHLECMKISK